MDSNISSKFTERAWSGAVDQIDKCLYHPFNLDLASGSLPKEKFNYYLVQDIRYLYLLSRDMGRISEMILSHKEIQHRFKVFAEGSLEYEYALQKELVDRYGIDLSRYPATSPAIDTYLSYTSSLLDEERLEEAIASHLPCFWIYYEVGRHLMQRIQSREEGASLLQKEHEQYFSWIASYSADEFWKDTQDYIRICDEIAQGAISPAGTNLEQLQQGMLEAFKKACAYEVSFWDECYAYATEELRDIGEFGFIRRFAPKFSHLLEGKEVVGIGDDCAILNASPDYEYLVSTDMLNEGIHFLKEDVDPFQLGYKSVAVNISDVAAMGGEPIGTFLSLGIPEGTPMAFLDAFMEGYHKISEEFGVPLLGGDTTRAIRELTINVAVIGRSVKGSAVLRSGAQEGDYICVTGFLGDAATGLKLILERMKNGLVCENEQTDYLISRHYMPSPRVRQGIFLAAHGAHAMMDISDGISSDLVHILKASGKSAQVDLDELPVSDELLGQVRTYGWNREELCTSGGEDYELLLTMKKEDYEANVSIFREKFGIPLKAVGQIMPASETAPEGTILWCKGDKMFTLDKKGFNHFR